jgi:hypothetical protein
MFICSMLTLKTVLKNQSKYLTYSHMIFWVIHILIRHFGLYIFSYDNLSCAYYHMTFRLYLFSDDILNCTYSYILWLHIGLCILSDDTLGCIYSHILILHFGFSIFSYFKMTFWVLPILWNQVIYCLTISWYQWCYL